MKDSEKMVEIAIVYFLERHIYYDDYETVISNITDWVTVTVEESKLLQEYIYDIGVFKGLDITPKILCKVDVVNTKLAVDEALEIVKEIAIEKERKADERKLKALKRKKSKQIKDEKDRKLLFKELQKEFASDTIVSE